jgi:hypothetical protein
VSSDGDQGFWAKRTRESGAAARPSAPKKAAAAKPAAKKPAVKKAATTKPKVQSAAEEKAEGSKSNAAEEAVETKPKATPKKTTASKPKAAPKPAAKKPVAKKTAAKPKAAPKGAAPTTEKPKVTKPKAAPKEEPATVTDIRDAAARRTAQARRRAANPKATADAKKRAKAVSMADREAKSPVAAMAKDVMTGRGASKKTKFAKAAVVTGAGAVGYGAYKQKKGQQAAEAGAKPPAKKTTPMQAATRNAESSLVKRALAMGMPKTHGKDANGQHVSQEEYARRWMFRNRVKAMRDPQALAAAKRVEVERRRKYRMTTKKK